MNTPIRILCPGSGATKAQRINELFEEIKAWLYSGSLARLIRLFGGNDLVDNIGSDFATDISRIEEFAKIWDFRKGNERWTVTDNDFIELNKDEILQCAEELGLVNIVETQQEPDYILPLGGARRSNKDRPAMSRKLIDDYGWNDKMVVALSGMRKISDQERPYMDYAPDAITEYDAINSGLELSFGVGEFEEETHEEHNFFLNSAVRKYKDEYNGNQIYSISAPSTEPDKRRANSEDTFRYFLKKFEVKPGDKILLVTSSIYVPYQTLKFMELAIEDGFEVDCVGSDAVSENSLSRTSNYLQEIKATIDAIYTLFTKYVR